MFANKYIIMAAGCGLLVKASHKCTGTASNPGTNICNTSGECHCGPCTDCTPWHTNDGSKPTCASN